MVEEKIVPKVESKTFKADYVADVYAFFQFTSSTGAMVGSLEVNSKTGTYNLEGDNFNWDEFVNVFKDIMTKDMIKDIVENLQVLRVPVGEQFVDQKNYYKIEPLVKKGD